MIGLVKWVFWCGDFDVMLGGEVEECVCIGVGV